MHGLLEHPLTKGLDLDDPRTTELRARILNEKAFLRSIYDEWYATIAAALPSVRGPVLELGAGAGFLRARVPGVIGSDVFVAPGVDVVLDGQQLPARDRSLRAVVMTNVLHHIPQPERFFTEAARTLAPGGRIIMLEPWVSAWSRVIYSRLHHEPFEPSSSSWSIPSTGPLSGANGALPWILFQRDRQQFERRFTELRVLDVRPTMPFRYLASGGVGSRLNPPGWLFPVFRTLEGILNPLRDRLAMFAYIVVEHHPTRA
jgi:SAM-dependent methyltransferase